MLMTPLSYKLIERFGIGYECRTANDTSNIHTDAINIDLHLAGKINPEISSIPQ